MEINNESMIIYYRKILHDKSKSEIVRKNARKELLKLIEVKEK